MPRGVCVDDQLCWTVIRMLAMSTPMAQIEMASGLSERTIRGIRRRFRNNADPCVPLRDPLLRSTHRMLNDEQIEVSFSQLTYMGLQYSI